LGKEKGVAVLLLCCSFEGLETRVDFGKQPFFVLGEREKTGQARVDVQTAMHMEQK
jgi:hypothetical protein